MSYDYSGVWKGVPALEMTWKAVMRAQRPTHMSIVLIMSALVHGLNVNWYGLIISIVWFLDERYFFTNSFFILPHTVVINVDKRTNIEASNQFFPMSFPTLFARQVLRELSSRLGDFVEVTAAFLTVIIFNIHTAGFIGLFLKPSNLNCKLEF